MFQEYLLQNWPLILILLAFIVSLITTVFLDKKTILRMCTLIVTIFLLSIAVFFEFYFAKRGEQRTLRIVLMAIRYSATPIIISQIGFTLIKKMRWFIFIPAIAMLIINVVSIFTGIVFSLNESGELKRGPLGYLPFIVVGIYSVWLIYLLIKRSNKRLMEILPIAFLAFAFASGLILPFIFRDAYATIFCTIIAVALFAYYEFLLLQLTKKDSLTGLLNRHAYYADIKSDSKNITALISLDMNGLKEVNDNVGHSAGDEALVVIALAINHQLKPKQSGYRIGGDEFVILCRKTSEEEVLELVGKLKESISETEYSCSIGYGLNLDGNKSITDLLKESDKMMYLEKDKYYIESGKDRRHSDA